MFLFLLNLQRIAVWVKWFFNIRCEKSPRKDKIITHVLVATTESPKMTTKRQKATIKRHTKTPWVVKVAQKHT